MGSGPVFTNVWDVLFPPDSQLANRLGQDLRDLRLDIQQRMRAISGLDASKPPFDTDTQPDNWNGILFFATDTGRVYQFNNPTWTDVTGSIGGGGGGGGGGGSNKIFQSATQTPHTGTAATVDIIYNIPVPAMANGNSIRVRLGFVVNAQGALTSQLRLVTSPTLTQLLADVPVSPTWQGFTIMADFLIAYSSADVALTLTQISAANFSFVQLLSSSGLTNQNLGIAWESGQTTDAQTFGPILAELIL